MRQLRPQVVEQRKRKLLQWVIHRYIKTSAPVPSQAIAQDAGMDLSSASIRNLLKELEDEGYLHQPHTSAGRIPTDKGYRFYVDYLVDVQRLAAEEKERIEQQYSRRIEEMDRLLSETSKLLSHVSHSAGLVLSPKIENNGLRRLELIPISGQQILAIVVTQTGFIRHWPITLPVIPTPAQLHRLNRFLNDNLQSKSIQEVQQAIEEKVEHAQRELHDLGELADSLLSELAQVQEPTELYMDGATQILAHPEDLGDLAEIQSLISVMEGKRALADLLEQEMQESLHQEQGQSRHRVHVSIGRENPLPELHHMSLITTTYRVNEDIVGVLGIMGSKRMEYSKMIGLVDHVSDVVSRTLDEWTKK